MAASEASLGTPRWKREALILAITVAVGFFALPAAIFWVGQELIGEYAQDSGMWALAEQIWSDLLALEPAAWVLVLSPSAIVQLVRLTARIWRVPKL